MDSADLTLAFWSAAVLRRFFDERHCTDKSAFCGAIIFPITAADRMRFLLSDARTFSSLLGFTQSNKPPLVCASVRMIWRAGGIFFQSVSLFAAWRLSRLPPGTQSRAIKSKTSLSITGTLSTEISALVPLARHMDAR